MVEVDPGSLRLRSESLPPSGATASRDPAKSTKGVKLHRRLRVLLVV
jgi:hypothetical protein